MEFKKLDLVLKRNPSFTKEQIHTVIACYMLHINLKLSKVCVIDLNIPKLGRIHTHGNKKDAVAIRKVKRSIKWTTNKNKFTDKELLF
jgi:hypothetical protein